MQALFLLWLVFAVAVTLFAALNAAPVSVNLIFGSYRASLALVILGSALLGALAGYTIDLVPRIRSRFRIKELEKRLRTVESDLDSCRGKLNSVSGERTAPAAPEQGSPSEL